MKFKLYHRFIILTGITILAMLSLLIPNWAERQSPTVYAQAASSPTFNAQLSKTGALSQTPVVSYTFNKDREGWLILGDANGGHLNPDNIALPYHSLAAGNPGGYIYAIDEVTGGTWYWLKRFTQTQNFSAAYGNALRFDLRQTSLDEQYQRVDLILSGGKPISKTIFTQLPYHPRTVWTVYNIPLDVSQRWRFERIGYPQASREDILAILANLLEIRIRGEYRDGEDTGSLDNVIIGYPLEESPRAFVDNLKGGRLKFTSTTTNVLEFPGGIYDQAFTVTVELSNTTALTNLTNLTGSGSLDLPRPPRSIGPGFTIRAQRGDGTFITQFKKAFTISVQYNPEEAQGLQEEGLQIYFRQSEMDMWRPITTTRNADTHTLTASIDHLTQFAAIGIEELSATIYLPLILRN